MTAVSKTVTHGWKIAQSATRAGVSFSGVKPAKDAAGLQSTFRNAYGQMREFGVDTTQAQRSEALKARMQKQPDIGINREELEKNRKLGR